MWSGLLGTDWKSPKSGALTHLCHEDLGDFRGITASSELGFSVCQMSPLVVPSIYPPLPPRKNPIATQLKRYISRCGHVTILGHWNPKEMLHGTCRKSPKREGEERGECLSACEQWPIHTMGCYSAVKRNKPRIQTTPRIYLKSIMLDGRIQTQKSKYWITAFIRSSRTGELIYNNVKGGHWLQEQERTF